MPTVISPSEEKRLVDGAFRAGGIGLWGMKRGRAWRPTLPAADGENACGDEATAEAPFHARGMSWLALVFMASERLCDSQRRSAAGLCAGP